MYSDEYIEHWGDIFVKSGGRDVFGIAFETFLRSPQACLHARDVSVKFKANRQALIDRQALCSADYEPLLPPQLRVRERLDELTDELGGPDAVLRNDRLVEPCRSHAWRGHRTADRHHRGGS